MICVSAFEHQIIIDIIKEYASDCDVFAFGSRYKWVPKDYSDLDLAFKPKNGEKLGFDRSWRIKDAFTESDLPYTVDVVDYYATEDYFKAIIDSGNEKIFDGNNLENM